ncbi:serine O-acetyltransferase EpsC [Streptomyces sp. NPDC002853]
MRRTLTRMRQDLAMIVDRDPSIHTPAEALLHPALPALWAHRAAHVLYTRGHRQLARSLAYLARAVTGGIEIHPGARLGRRVFIDHGAAVVIGETAEIGDDVTIFHQVTLGAIGWWRDERRAPGARRHPVVGDRVVLGTNAIVLGPVTVGADALIGAGSLVLGDVPPRARVTAPPAGVVVPLSAAERAASEQLLHSLATAGCW